MKPIVPVFLLSAIVSASVAQQPVVVSVGAGVNNTSPASKEKNYLGNGYDVQGNIFIPFMSKADGKFTLGILTGGTYYTSKNLAPEASKLQSLYKLYNGNLEITNIRNGGSTSDGFTGTIGLQADFALSRLILSPSLSGGYFSLKQDGFAERSAVMVNGTTQTITLADLNKRKKTGFITIPQLKISYQITGAVGVYTSASFNIGPSISSDQRILEPQGGFNDKNTYEPSQLSAGKMINRPVSVNYRTTAMNIGINWSLGRKIKTSTMPSRLSMTPTTARQTQGRSFGEKVEGGLQSAGAKSNNPLYEDKGTHTTNPLSGQSQARPGSPIGGIVVKGGKNPGGNLMVVKSDNNGVFELEGLEAGRYSFNLELPGEPQGKSINEKGVKRSDATEQGRPGSPIGGIVVKGGKNPGGNMTNLGVSNEGRIEFEVLEAGDYKFIIQTAGEADKNKNKLKRAKVVEKATSGLKDTLKTNV